MRGLFKRKGSDVWQGRFRIPEDLWRERGRLMELGVKNLGKSQEFAKSTRCLDRDDAGVEYRRMMTAWDARIEAWRKLLQDGPQALTHKQQVALAAEHAKAFLAAHEDDPFQAPLDEVTPSLRNGDEEVRSLLASLDDTTLHALHADLGRLPGDGRPEGLRPALALLKKYPSLTSIVSRDLAAGLEEVHGADLDAVLEGRDLNIDATSRRLLSLTMAELMGSARRGLEARQRGDYGPIKELENAPAFEHSPSPKPLHDSRFTFSSIIDAETKRRASGRDAKPFPQATVKKYSKRGEEFVAWRRSQGLKKDAAADASTVTRQEVERWRAALVGDKTASLSNRTINDKVSCLVTIMKWGRRHYRDDGFHPDVNPIEGIEKLGFVETPSNLRTYRIEEAVQVLKAARLETEPRRRWLSWICAYTGLRIEEAGQLTVEDFFQVQGRWFFRVSTSGRRSLKTASSERRIPLHPSLIKEGLLEFVQARKSGRLFASRRVQPLMSEWVRETVKIARPELSPNHGWRHFFEDLCGLANMPDAARDYMTGRSSGRSREMYGKSELMLPGLAEAMDRLPDIIKLGASAPS